MIKQISIATTEGQATKLTLGQLDEQIEVMARRYQSASRPRQRRDAFRLLVWLEKCRERMHGIRAPRRQFLSGDPTVDES